MAEQDPLAFGVSNRTRTPGVNQDDRQRIAGNVAANSRRQAAAGALGTTLGDNSGTGANTPGATPAPTDRFLNRPTTDGVQRDNEALASSRSELQDTIRSVDLAQRRGNISARSALGIREDAASALGSTGANQLNTLADADVALRGQDVASQDRAADREASFRELLAQNENQLNIAEGRTATDLQIAEGRLGESQADRALSAELGRGELAARSQTAQAAAETAELRRQEVLARLGLDERQFAQQSSADNARLALEGRRVDLAENQALVGAARDQAQFEQSLGYEGAQRLTSALGNLNMNDEQKSMVQQIILETLGNTGR